MGMTTNHYSATRNPATGRWVGWVSFSSSPTSTTETPDTYPTKREAIAAIKEQHPA